MELAKKIGDDWTFDVRNVASGRTGQNLDAAIVTWKLYDREEAPIANGNATLYDAPTASFEFSIPKAITVVFPVQEHYRLDVIATHAGNQTTRSLELVAVVNVPAGQVAAPIDFAAGALIGLATVEYVDTALAAIGGDMTIYSLIDGTRAFTGVVEGVTPVLAEHLATKNYVDVQDNAVLVTADASAGAGDVATLAAAIAAADVAADIGDAAIVASLIVYTKIDGSRAFTNPVAGITPTDPAHLVTKAYADALGGGGTPGGAGTQLQYNNAGAFGGVAELTYAAGLVALKKSDAATNTITSVFVIGHNTSGTPAAGFGSAIDLLLQSSTTVDRPAGHIRVKWLDATDATRKAAVEIGVNGQFGYSPAIYVHAEGVNWNNDAHKVSVTLRGDVPTIVATDPWPDTALTLHRWTGALTNPHLRLANAGGGGCSIWVDSSSNFNVTGTFTCGFGVFVRSSPTGMDGTSDRLDLYANGFIGASVYYGSATLMGVRLGDPAKTFTLGLPFYDGTTVVVHSTDDTASGLQIWGHSAAQSAPLQEWCDHNGVVAVAIGPTSRIYVEAFSPKPGGSAQYFDAVSSVFRAVGGSVIIEAGALTFGAGINIILDTTTGTKIGTGTTQKLAFWNATPVVQPTAITDADGTLADINTKFNALLAKLRTLGLIAT